MSTLRLGIELESFDLERVGFILSVLDENAPAQAGGRLRMTLDELAGFIAALKADCDVELLSLPEGNTVVPASDLDGGASKGRPTAEVISLPGLSRRRRPADDRAGKAAKPEKPRKLRAHRREMADAPV